MYRGSKCSFGVRLSRDCMGQEVGHLDVSVACPTMLPGNFLICELSLNNQSTYLFSKV